MKNYCNSVFQKFILLFIFLQICLAGQAQITEIYTDWGGWWKSTTTVPNAIIPNNSHNVTAFKYNGTIYSTGVNDVAALVNLPVFGWTAASFKALPITSIGGTPVASSTYIALGGLYDGVSGGISSPLPSLRMTDVLTDGVNGLNIGTGVTNIPKTASLNFPIGAIPLASVSSTVPVLLLSQTAMATAISDTFYFATSANVLVGTKVLVSWTAFTKLGTYSCDLYNLTATTCDAATITGSTLYDQPKDIRLQGLTFSDLGINSGNYTSVAKLILKPGGDSDPAFVAYNANLFSILTPVILLQPVTPIIVCPGTGNTATFSVTALLATSYQWKKNGTPITGATSATYTITNVSAADAGLYEVDVTNSAGTITSSISYLNTAITFQPAASQTIATGNSVTLSIAATNATSYQWKKNTVDIAGATGASYTMNPLSVANGASYTVNVVNPLSSGCATVLSIAAVVIADTILFSKSTGNLNVAANWGVNTDGTGSNPVDFTRTEHIFKIANQTTAVTGANLTIAGTLDVANAITTITPGTLLNAAKIIRTGTGSISGSATSDLSVNGTSVLNFTTGSQVIKNLIVKGGAVTLNTKLDITPAGSLVISAGTFSTSDSLTLKSDATATAFLGNSPGTISGKITIERYIPARRAWRLMTAPVTATGAPTINAAWQEGAMSSAADPNPGYGTHITGGTAANGFDHNPNGSTSLKFLNGNNWAAVASTYSIPVTQYPGYMFFIRGNRSYNIASTTPSVTALTTLIRVKGNVNQGTQSTKTITAAGYTLAGNPYASPVDFSLINAASTNVKNRFRVWDPQLGGTSGVGAYVLLDWNGSAYTSSPSTTLNGIIQAGQAFFLETTDGVTSGSFIVNESHKSISSSTSIPFGKVQGNQDANIVADLKILNEDSTLSTADGVLAHYNNDYSDGFDGDDAIKFFNINENLAIVEASKFLSITRRTVPVAGDTLHLSFTGIKNINYQFELTLQNFSATGLQPFLCDKYLGSITKMEAVTEYPFSINADASSKAADRFGIIFKTPVIIPLNVLSVKANLYNETSVNIDWNVTSQAGVHHYEIQRKNELDSFETIGSSVAAKTSTSAYNFKDLQLQTLNNFYRIKSIYENGEIKYSDTVNIKLSQSSAFISIWPNPVTGNTIRLVTQNIEKGKYSYSITNTIGQLILHGVIDHANGQPFENIRFINKPAAGSYKILISRGNTVYRAALLVAD